MIFERLRFSANQRIVQPLLVTGLRVVSGCALVVCMVPTGSYFEAVTGSEVVFHQRHSDVSMLNLSDSVQDVYVVWFEGDEYRYNGPRNGGAVSFTTFFSYTSITSALLSNTTQVLVSPFSPSKKSVNVSFLSGYAINPEAVPLVFDPVLRVVLSDPDIMSKPSGISTRNRFCGIPIELRENFTFPTRSDVYVNFVESKNGRWVAHHDGSTPARSPVDSFGVNLCVTENFA